MNMIQAFWCKVAKPIVVAIAILLIFVILGIWLAVKADAADLKCVTIKFKNDSELKLKTQWFVNHCDTTGWYMHDNSPALTCRTLLFPPDIRREPVIKSGYYRYHTDGHVTISDSLVVADTIEGEALLWYEETKP